jgi:hypothetical protein
LIFFLGNIHSSLLEIDVNKENVFDEVKTKWPTGFWTQYKNLTLRSFKLSASTNKIDSHNITEILLKVVLNTLTLILLLLTVFILHLLVSDELEMKK